MTQSTVTRLASSELALARLAADLGAASVGGPLAAGERELLSRVRQAPASTAALLDATRAAIAAGDDPLGEAFCELRSPLRRRDAGQFFTPPNLVEPMIEYVLAGNPSRLIDPGCGSGRFTAAALRRRPELVTVSIDPDPLAALMTRAALAVLGASHSRVLCGSYLTAELDAHDGVTAFVGNPPYVRHHDLSSDDKAWATATAKGLGHRVSGLAGLHALFFLATMVHARRGDIGCFVTSSEWIDVGYGAIVRNLLTNGMGGVALDLVDPRAVPFADAMTTALITCFEIGAQPGEVSLRRVESPDELTRLGGGTPVPTATITASGRWSPLFGALDADEHDGARLGDLVRVHRGFVTGANAFFIMTRADADERGLSDWVRPAITSAAEIIGSGGVIRDAPDRKVLLDLPADFDRSAHPAVDAYLRSGEASGVDQTYISRHRRPWFRVAPKDPAPIVASYMARQAPVFALNPDRLVLLNIDHGLYPRAPMTKRALRNMVHALNGARNRYAGAGRTYHGGLEKFEPSEMEALPVPDL